jgi:hypothetical protein
MIESHEGAFHVQTMSRRGVILGGTSAATLVLGFPLRSSARDTVAVDEFRSLSSRLTEARLSDLDMTAVAKLLDGFLSMGRGAELAALVPDGASSGTLADEIVAAWYSGSYETSAGLAAFNLTDALLWDALDFAKPPGLCGGATGYWAAPPQP